MSRDIFDYSFDGVSKGDKEANEDGLIVSLGDALDLSPKQGHSPSPDKPDSLKIEDKDYTKAKKSIKRKLEY